MKCAPARKVHEMEGDCLIGCGASILITERVCGEVMLECEGSWQCCHWYPSSVGPACALLPGACFVRPCSSFHSEQ